MGDDFTARWRKAQADLHRAQRTRRTRRTGPAITGIRKPAPEGGHMARMTLADEQRGMAVSHVPGLAVDISVLVKALDRISKHGQPEQLGDAGVSIRLYNSASVCHGSVIVTQAPWDNDTEWIHASIALEQRMPGYAELAALKAGVFGPDRYAFQVFAPERRHVNIHQHALHLWGRADGRSPLPDFGVLGTI